MNMKEVLRELEDVYALLSPVNDEDLTEGALDKLNSLIEHFKVRLLDPAHEEKRNLCTALAAKAWTFPETEGHEMDVELAGAFRRVLMEEFEFLKKETRDGENEETRV